MIGSIDPTTDAGRVHTMDLIFAYVAFVSSSIAFTQTQIYPSHNCLRQTKVTVTALLSFFLFAAILEAYLNVPLKRYTGISLIDLSAFIKAGSSLIKYLFQIRENFINKSVQGLSKSAFWTDFMGTIFCFAQLQVDSMIAGFSSFFADPHVNLAKTLIAFFGLVNTSIILTQIHLIYPGLPR